VLDALDVSVYARSEAAGAGGGSRPVVFLLPGGDAAVLPVVAGLGDEFQLEMLPPGWDPADLVAEGAVALLASGHQVLEARLALRTLTERGGPPVLALLQPADLDTSVVYACADFAVCPCRVPEIAARLRRLTGGDLRSEVGQTWGGLHLDEDRHEATANGARLDLTYTEFRLLALLMALRGRVVTRDRAYKDIWATDHHFGGLRTVDVHIRRLRSKLEAHGCGYITTVRNVGYRLREP